MLSLHVRHVSQELPLVLARMLCRRHVRLVTVALLMAGGAFASGCQRSSSPADEPAATTDTASTAASPAASPSVASPMPNDESAGPPGVLRAYVWACEDGRTLSMRNLFRERAITLDFQDGTQRLDSTVSASGTRYATPDESIVFWSKESTATLERRGAATVQCAERRADSLREDARLRGVIYRALGNEPGWTLEIGPGGRLDWTTNYGQDRYVFEGAIESAAASGPGGRTFTASNGAESIVVTVDAAPCTDDAGIAHEATAIIEFDGGTLRGCATRLN
jgi:membrane-bound inhibitor of C-type lysozyme/uncharacterized membrane protein